MIQISLKNIFSLSDARSKFSQIIKDAEKGEAFLITKGGKPVVAIASTEMLGKIQKQGIVTASKPEESAPEAQSNPFTSMENDKIGPKVPTESEIEDKESEISDKSGSEVPKIMQGNDKEMAQEGENIAEPQISVAPGWEKVLDQEIEKQNKEKEQEDAETSRIIKSDDEFKK